MNDFLDAILNAVQSVDPALRTLIAGLGMLLETSVLVGLVVPGDAIVLVSSTAVSSPAEYWALVIAVITGAVCGESIGFALGRFFGPRIMHSALGRRIGEEKWMRAERYLERRGGIAVFVSRFLPVLHSLVPVTVGASTMSYRRFLAWTIPANVIWAFAYVTFGSLAAGSYRDLSDKLHIAGYLFVAIVAVFVVIVFATKFLLSRAEGRHMDARVTPPKEQESPTGSESPREQ